MGAGAVRSELREQPTLRRAGRLDLPLFQQEPGRILPWLASSDDLFASDCGCFLFDGLSAGFRIPSEERLFAAGAFVPSIAFADWARRDPLRRLVVGPNAFSHRSRPTGGHPRQQPVGT